MAGSPNESPVAGEVSPGARYGSLALKDQISVAPELPGMAPVLARRLEFGYK